MSYSGSEVRVRFRVRVRASVVVRLVKQARGKIKIGQLVQCGSGLGDTGGASAGMIVLLQG